MRGIYTLCVGAFLISFFLAGCSEFSFFNSKSEEPDGLVIRSIEQGAVLKRGAEIPVRYELLDETVIPATLTIEIRQDGSIDPVASKTIPIGPLDGGEDTENPQSLIILPDDLEPGYYILVLTVRGGDEDDVISVREFRFFLLDGDAVVNGIDIYPSIVFPGGKALLLADISIPEGMDPYLRWSLTGQVLKEGYLSEGNGSCNWTAPQREGVYSITLELFPWGPGESPFDFSSQIKIESEIFVYKKQLSEKNELKPPESYFTLFHFRGEYQDYSLLGSDRVIGMTGSPHLEIGRNFFGFKLNGEDGITVDSLLVPVSESAVGPFSVVIRGSFDTEQTGRSIFTTSNDSVSFSLDIDDAGFLTSSLAVNGAASVSRTGISVGSGLTNLSLSLIPQADECTFVWYIDGLTQKVDTLPLKYEGDIDESGGSAEIAGKGGYRGILDEFGIYFEDGDGRPAVDPFVFSSIMAQHYGNDLIYAEGFDGLYLPKNFEAEGGFSMKGSSLVLNGGSKAVIRNVSFRTGTAFRISINGKMEKPVIRLTPADDFDDIVIDGSGNIAAAAGKINVYDESGENISFDLISAGNVLLLHANDETVELRNDFPAVDQVTVVFENPNEDIPAGISDILVYDSTEVFIPKN